MNKRKTLPSIAVILLYAVFKLACGLTSPGITEPQGRRNGNLTGKEGKKRLINRDQCRLDLGKWTIEDIDKMLAKARNIKHISPRVKFIVFHFINTPFGFESLLKIPGKGVLPVRFSTFDCITFGHYMLALNMSENFDQFIENLVKLRYKDPGKLGIDSDPVSGNILDFTYNILLVNAVNWGMVRNVTGDILSGKGLAGGTITRDLKPLERKPEMGGGRVVPKYGSKRITISFILPDDIDRVADAIETGDMILFVTPMRPGKPNTFFGHGGIVLKGKDIPLKLRQKNGIPGHDNHIYFVHSSMSRGLDGERLGVCIAGQETYLDSLIYDVEKPRLLSHYCKGVGWLGVVILRMTPGSAK